MHMTPTYRVQCPSCERISKLDLSETEYYNVTEGQMPIQVALSRFSPEDREIVLSGLCKVCQAKIFKPRRCP